VDRLTPDLRRTRGLRPDPGPAAFGLTQDPRPSA